MSPSEADVRKRVGAAPGTPQLDRHNAITLQTSGKSFHLFMPKIHVPFLHDYSMLKFGWDVAQRLAFMRKEFPLHLGGADQWVYKAWAVLRYGDHAVSKKDLKVILDAWSLEFDDAQIMTSAALKAQLLCYDSTIENVARDMALDYELVEAFETLFYNAIGRREDLTFLRNAAYPNSRYVELLPDYRSNGRIADMLIRTGYNSDRQTTLFMSGYRPRGFMDETVDQSSSKFQQQLMQTGAVMASTGMLWLDRSHTTLAAARSFLQTSKLSGETVGANEGLLSLSESMRGEMDRLSIEVKNEVDERAKSAL